MINKVSVIIVNYNVKDLLHACIDSLYKNSSDDSLEVIVVDNASTDGSENYIRQAFPKVIWIGNKSNMGFSAANNQGLRLATGEALFLLNPDTVLMDGVLPGLMKKLNENPKNVIVPKLLNSDGSLQLSCWRFPEAWGVILESLYLHLLFNPYNYSIDKFNTQFNPDCASGAALLFGRDVYEVTNGLDENMFWSEDIDFCYVSTKAGMPLIYFPEYKIYHHSGKSSKSNLNIPISNQLLSKAKYLRKHYGFFTWVIALIFILFHIISRILIFGILSIFKSEPFAKKRRAYLFTFKRYFEYVLFNSKSLT